MVMSSLLFLCSSTIYVCQIKNRTRLLRHRFPNVPSCSLKSFNYSFCWPLIRAPDRKCRTLIFSINSINLFIIPTEYYQTEKMSDTSNPRKFPNKMSQRIWLIQQTKLICLI